MLIRHWSLNKIIGSSLQVVIWKDVYKDIHRINKDIHMINKGIYVKDK